MEVRHRPAACSQAAPRSHGSFAAPIPGAGWHSLGGPLHCVWRGRFSAGHYHSHMELSLCSIPRSSANESTHPAVRRILLLAAPLLLLLLPAHGPRATATAAAALRRHHRLLPLQRLQRRQSAAAPISFQFASQPGTPPLKPAPAHRHNRSRRTQALPAPVAMLSVNWPRPCPALGSALLACVSLWKRGRQAF